MFLTIEYIIHRQKNFVNHYKLFLSVNTYFQIICFSLRQF